MISFRCEHERIVQKDKNVRVGLRNLRQDALKLFNFARAEFTDREQVAKKAQRPKGMK